MSCVRVLRRVRTSQAVCPTSVPVMTDRPNRPFASGLRGIALSAATCLAVIGGTSNHVRAQQAGEATFESAAQSIQDRLAESLAELSALRQNIVAEKIPLAEQLSELENELLEARSQFQEKSIALETRSLDLNNLTTDNKLRQDEVDYLASLLAEYVRNFDARIHVTELDRYREMLETARLAEADDTLDDAALFAVQADVILKSIDRLDELAGGARFETFAVDKDGLRNPGTVALVGPAAVFRSADGRHVGTAAQRLNAIDPAILEFGKPEDAEAAASVAAAGAGEFPFDPTLGDAHAIEATHETFFEHVSKGGAVMIPIFAMAALALLVALYKWISLSLLGKPSRRQLAGLYAAIEDRDLETAARQAAEIRGPVGRMLSQGVKHAEEPRELIEEVMYESVLKTRLETQSMLPFVGICAASAPLLGLLGTVTGIISTFAMITLYGSGDAKTLSGGISEALITTKFGLIVAIPTLLLHAYLSRKARNVTGEMETAALAFVNRVSKAMPRERLALPMAGRLPLAEPVAAAGSNGVDPAAVRDQVRTILQEMLGPLAPGSGVGDRSVSNNGAAAAGGGAQAG